MDDITKNKKCISEDDVIHLRDVAKKLNTPQIITLPINLMMTGKNAV